MMATHSQPAARHRLLGLSVNATSAWLRTQLGLPDLLDPTADLPDLEALRVLRAALRALFEVSMRGRPPPASALAAVNQASAGLATFSILAWSARTEPIVHSAPRMSSSVSKNRKASAYLAGFDYIQTDGARVVNK